MKKEYDLIILTTSVNRPDLHKDTFFKYCEFVDGLDCLWLINIDHIGYGNSLDETEINLNKILSKWNNIDFEFFVNENGGNWNSFYKAAHRLTNKANQFNSKYGIFWLEDDWGLNFEHKLKDIFENVNFSDMDYLQLRKRNLEVSFNPSVFGWGIFKKYNYPKINDETNAYWMGNPERAVVYPVNSVKVENHYYCPYFFDVGREWSDKNIEKKAIDSTDPKRTYNS